MFTIEIKSAKTGFKFFDERSSDWMRNDMKRAVEIAFQIVGGTCLHKIDSISGDVYSAGVLSMTLWAEDEFVKALGAILKKASWRYQTLEGYGAFLEELIVLKNARVPTPA